LNTPYASVPFVDANHLDRVDGNGKHIHWTQGKSAYPVVLGKILKEKECESNSIVDPHGRRCRDISMIGYRRGQQTAGESHSWKLLAA
jgi:hypothetical protein